MLKESACPRSLDKRSAVPGKNQEQLSKAVSDSIPYGQQPKLSLNRPSVKGLPRLLEASETNNPWEVQEEYSVHQHAPKKAPWAYNLSRHVASARGSVIEVQAGQTTTKELPGGGRRNKRGRDVFSPREKGSIICAADAYARSPPSGPISSSSLHAASAPYSGKEEAHAQRRWLSGPASEPQLEAAWNLPTVWAQIRI
ncbi:hypothetical protein DPX16_5122 [Anabarilius grahami]|uniref:Uncharacterized protein n=1 Tax=Anabarilius grahami TaxID=495550 RepID=A0A3N0XKY0_ANAGA|nr:hypothetical protein DPX16_5122 [Anabarilius grahami]